MSRSGRRGSTASSALLFGLASVVGLLASSSGTQDAVANGDTRALTIFHTHSGESATITFRRNGRYDPDGLKQLDWILRDWRNGKQTNMDPRLFDAVWEVYREVGSHQPVNIVSAYRSPETNGMLHRRSRAVSEHSQHMAGRAMDIRLPDIDAARLRAAAIHLQHGGVGYYPGRDAFVHIDVASVRAWPRMTREQLVRLFPDGKTVHLPSRGSPLPGYELAKAQLLARGDMVAGEGGRALAEAGGGQPNLLASLLGLFSNADQAEDTALAESGRTTRLAALAPVSPPEIAEVIGVSAPLPPRRAGATEVGLAAEAPGQADPDVRILFAANPMAAAPARFEPPKDGWLVARAATSLIRTADASAHKP